MFESSMDLTHITTTPYWCPVHPRFANIPRSVVNLYLWYLGQDFLAIQEDRIEWKPWKKTYINGEKTVTYRGEVHTLFELFDTLTLKGIRFEAKRNAELAKLLECNLGTQKKNATK